MATALATTAAPVQFDFQNNNVEVMTLDTLRRTHKENDIYGNPLKGIYHYEVIERMADICQKHNLNYEVEEIFAAQNKNKAQPGVVVLPQVEQKYGAMAVEAHILRRVYTTIRIKEWETDELTTTLVIPSIRTASRRPSARASGCATTSASSPPNAVCRTTGKTKSPPKSFSVV